MSLMQKILHEIEAEAIEQSKRAVENRAMIEEAEALQKTLIEHGCTHAEPTWVCYGAIIFYDHSDDGSMRRALALSGIETKILGSQANTDNSHTEQLSVQGSSIRIWITTWNQQLAEAA